MQVKLHTESELSTAEFSTRLGNFKKLIARDDLGFFRITEEQQILKDVENIKQQFSDRKYFVQIGIGGSALGPEMLVSALGKSEKSFFCFDNPDSDYLAKLLAKINLKESIFYVVSKSGGTAETIACYSMVRNQLKAAGITDFKNYFVFCTDPTSGELREHVNKNEYTSLSVPSNIGGRFSVLSPVGLLPASFMGVDIAGLFEGANEIKPQLLSQNFGENILFKSAQLTYQAYLEGTNETVLMPYSSLLKEFSAWFVQLWAESLGKKSDTGPVGLTPIAAYGATDQHSQVQLFMEGPNNKLMFLIEVENRQHDYTLDSELELTRAKDLAPYKMNQLLNAEFRGNLQALKEQDRNIIEINLKKLDEQAMGAMIMYFESLTALMGEYLAVDAFNQPGVEKGKKYTFEFLKAQV